LALPSHLPGQGTTLSTVWPAGVGTVMGVKSQCNTNAPTPHWLPGFLRAGPSTPLDKSELDRIQLDDATMIA
jgi:hypothetical protein